MRGAARTAIALTTPPPLRAGAPISRWERGGGKIKMGGCGQRRAGRECGERQAKEARIAVAAEWESEQPGVEALAGRAQALGAAGRVCLAHFRQNEPAVLAGDPEGVHQMRVALRRLRAAVAALKGAMPVEDRRAVSGELAWLDALLAPVRNLDVVLLDLLPPVRRAFPGDPDLDHLAGALAWARRAAHDRLTAELRSAGHEPAMLALARRFAGCGASAPPEPDEPTIGALLPALLDRRWRMVKRRSKGFRRQSPRARHRLRIAVKKLRYAIELFGGVLPGNAAGALLKTLRRVQDGLGYASDVRAARAVLRRLRGGAAPQRRLARAGKRLFAWHQHALAKRERKLRRDLRRLRRTPRFWDRDEGTLSP
ncbi:MAG: CHAD domain-containing protein [Stellaceae bacterium]